MSLDLAVGGAVREDDMRMAYVAVETSPVVLRCTFLADPVPSVTWLLDGVAMDTNQPGRYAVETKYEDTNVPIGNYTQTLTILRVVSQDAGEYTCVGANRHGSLQAMEALVVIGQSGEAHKHGVSNHSHSASTYSAS